MEAADGQDWGITEIAYRECVELLRSQGVGRLGVVVRGRPEIFPVNTRWTAAAVSCCGRR